MLGGTCKVFPHRSFPFFCLYILHSHVPLGRFLYPLNPTIENKTIIKRKHKIRLEKWKIGNSFKFFLQKRLSVSVRNDNIFDNLCTFPHGFLYISILSMLVVAFGTNVKFKSALRNCMSFFKASISPIHEFGHLELKPWLPS